MAFEMITRNYFTPQRLYALVCLVGVMREPARREVIDALQPLSIVGREESQDMGERLYRAAIQLGLIQELETKDRRVRLRVAQDHLASLTSFREHLRGGMLGVTEEHVDHYLLNLVAAWYAVQDEAVVRHDKTEIARRFNEQMYPGAPEQTLSEHPGLTTWFLWAEFFGWGWPLKFDTAEADFMPDATGRVRPVLSRLLPEVDQEVPLGNFLTRLAEQCPEMDGGRLFRRCWDASRPNQERGNRLSLTLSTALRVLQRGQLIELLERKDATSWTLFPAQTQVPAATHIRRTEVRP